MSAGSQPVARDDVEATYLNVPTAASAEAHLRYITSRPHVAGTDGDFVMADYVKQQMLSYGLESKIENVTVLLNYPEEAPSLTLTRADGAVVPVNLAELVLAEDKTSDTVWRNHTFHGYAASGTGTGPLVYANYGRPQDFDILKGLGVNISGKVVLVRYGKCFRGLKVKNAQELGATAVLIYSDPADDGFVQGNTYPKGPWRPEFGVQRGSVQFNSLCAGDPARAAGPASVEELCGYSTQDLIPSIPSIPLSYAAATDLLKQLGGATAPPEFQGGLDIAYTVGPSVNYTVTLCTKLQSLKTPIPNVITVIPGRDNVGDMLQLRPVIVGNHRDAWVYGAADPNSGTAALLELAKGLGVLKQRGWQPERTIFLCSWSGEEYGLLGSTAWGELHASTVRQAVAYLNVDTVAIGSVLKAGGTFALRNFFEQAASDVEDPAGGALCLQRTWEPIGSGSDYTVFLDHFGVASMDFAFARVGAQGDLVQYGQYHSVYDSFDWISRFGAGGTGPGKAKQAFAYMKAGAEVWGLLTLRLADAKVLPFNHSAQAVALEDWHAELAKAEPQLDTRELSKGISAYMQAAKTAEMRAANMLRLSTRTAEASRVLAELNDRLAFTERQFLSEDGLPMRKWFKHLLQAPGFNEGYAPRTFPSIADGLRIGGLARGQEELARLAGRINAAAQYLAPAEELIV